MTGKTRGWIALGIIVVTALALVFAAILFERSRHLTDEPFSLSNSGQVIPSESAQHHVVGVAEQFCLRMDTFKGNDAKGYVKSVSELLTTKEKTSINQEFSDFSKLGIAPDIESSGDILASGLAEMDSDSATVLVAHDSTVKEGSNTTQRHYRWSITMRKVGGKWLVDDFTPAT